MTRGDALDVLEPLMAEGDSLAATYYVKLLAGQITVDEMVAEIQSEVDRIMVAWRWITDDSSR